MGNLFIGFPVPRAKIAEMIEGSAPPLEHKENHEPDGSDPLVLPGDISEGQIVKWDGSKFIGADEPTGGLANLYADLGFHFKTSFPTLDEFSTSTAVTGSITHTYDKIVLATGATTSSWADLRKNTAYQLPLLTFDKDIFLKFRFVFNSYSDINPNSYILIGDAVNHKHVGISMYNSKFCSTCHDGASRSQETIISGLTSGADYEYIVEIKFYAGSGAEYWIDGTLRRTVTYRIPSGAFYNECFLNFGVDNSNTTRDIQLALSMIEFYQPAA